MTGMATPYRGHAGTWGIVTCMTEFGMWLAPRVSRARDAEDEVTLDPVDGYGRASSPKSWAMLWYQVSSSRVAW